MSICLECLSVYGVWESGGGVGRHGPVTVVSQVAMAPVSRMVKKNGWIEEQIQHLKTDREREMLNFSHSLFDFASFS